MRISAITIPLSVYVTLSTYRSSLSRRPGRRENSWGNGGNLTGVGGVATTNPSLVTHRCVVTRVTLTNHVEFIKKTHISGQIRNNIFKLKNMK